MHICPLKRVLFISALKLKNTQYAKPFSLIGCAGVLCIFLSKEETSIGIMVLVLQAVRPDQGGSFDGRICTRSARTDTEIRGLFRAEHDGGWANLYAVFYRCEEWL